MSGLHQMYGRTHLAVKITNRTPLRIIQNVLNAYTTTGHAARGQESIIPSRERDARGLHESRRPCFP